MQQMSGSPDDKELLMAGDNEITGKSGRDGVVQGQNISIADTLEILQSCIKTSIMMA